MAKIFGLALVMGFAMMFAVTGCGKKGTPGGPGATGDTKKSKTVGTADSTFTLDVPTFSTKIKQGEEKVVTIGIKRGKDFSEDVKLQFGDLPKGVTISPKSADLKSSETEAKITVKAADDAALGDHTVAVTGHPAAGPDATNEFKITINKK